MSEKETADNEDLLQKFVDSIKILFIALFFVSLASYVVLLGLYACDWAPQSAKNFFDTSSPHTIGLPVCGATAFAVVCILERMQPSKTNSRSGKLEFKAFSLTFSGPAGPATLWIACYLAMVASMKLL